MIWQDAVFGLGQGILVLSMIPLIRNPEARMPRTTSIPSSAILFAFSASYISLGLYGGALSTAASASIWAWLAWRRPTSQAQQSLVLRAGQNLRLVPPGCADRRSEQRSDRPGSPR